MLLPGSLPKLIHILPSCRLPKNYAILKADNFKSESRKMKHIILILCLFIQSISSFAQTRKAVFIIVDGVPHDVIEKLSLPNFKAIAKQGGFAKTLVGGVKNDYSQTPTISAVGYNSVLTGTWVNKHNVWDNDIKAPNYHYHNIFRFLKAQSPQKKIGIFSSWLDNRTRLVGDGLPEAGNIHFDYHTDGLELDTIHYPHDKNGAYMHRIDETVADEAALSIKTNAPDLSWVYLEYTDDMGHRYGDGPEFYKAVEYADKQVGRIWEAIQYRQKNFKEDWLIVITTDHGRDAQTGKDHGGQSDRERAGWIVTNAKGLNGRFKKDQSALVDIMPTVARFMKIEIPLDAQREVDGVPLTGKISLANPSIMYNGHQAAIRWEALEKKGTVKIWAATANNYKTGSRDEYRLLKEVPLSSGKTTVDLKDLPSSFYKIVLQAPHNMVNRWIIADRKK
jgi:predicted AlkP superfamily pyrophosphatase or phosphodiesterase